MRGGDVAAVICVYTTDVTAARVAAVVASAAASL